MDQLLTDKNGDLSVNIDLRALILATGNERILLKLEALMERGSHTAVSATALLNSQLTVKVDQNGDASFKIKSFDSFNPFRKLPTELRLKIWRNAMPGPRIVEITLHERIFELKGFSSPSRDQHCVIVDSPTPPPVTLHVNQESRKETSKQYQPIFQGSIPDSLLHTQTEANKQACIIRPVYINFEEDTPFFAKFICLTPSAICETDPYLIRMLYQYLMTAYHSNSRLELSKVKRIAFCVGGACLRLSAFYMNSALSRLSTLEEVCVVTSTSDQDSTNRSMSSEMYREISLTETEAIDTVGHSTFFRHLIEELEKTVTNVSANQSGSEKHQHRLLRKPEIIIKKAIRDLRQI